MVARWLVVVAHEPDDLPRQRTRFPRGTTLSCDLPRLERTVRMPVGTIGRLGTYARRTTRLGAPLPRDLHNERQRPALGDGGRHRGDAAYRRRQREPGFAEAWRLAQEDAVDSLEAEARRRALATSDGLLLSRPAAAPCQGARAGSPRCSRSSGSPPGRARPRAARRRPPPPSRRTAANRSARRAR